MFGAAAASFALGDLLLGVGRSLLVWLVAGFCASRPIPIIGARLNTVQYAVVPPGLQGRVFAILNAVEPLTMPIGLLGGGVLADRVFEPMMASGTTLARTPAAAVGTGPGSGMTATLLCTGTLGFISSIVCSRNRSVRTLIGSVYPRT